MVYMFMRGFWSKCTLYFGEAISLCDFGILQASPQHTHHLQTQIPNSHSRLALHTADSHSPCRPFPDFS